MNPGIIEISLQGLVLAFLPAAAVLVITWRWHTGAGSALYALLRMLLQLLLIGYVLIYIFESDNYAVILAVLTVMIVIASWIAVRPLGDGKKQSWPNALVAIVITSVLILAVVTQAVIGLEPWFSPRYVVPIGGMVVSGAMNAVSLAAERLQSELSRGAAPRDARHDAFRTAMIPITNSLFAVGLVSLPGMMTGQILSGVSPLIAAKYQMVVMSMLFGTGGLAASIYLVLELRRRQRAAH